MALSNISVAVTEANVQVDITNTSVTVGQTVSNVVVGDLNVTSDTDIREAISFTNVHGSGGLSYSQANGVITYDLFGGNGIGIGGDGSVGIDLAPNLNDTPGQINYLQFSNGLKTVATSNFPANALVSTDANGTISFSNVIVSNGGTLQTGTGNFLHGHNSGTGHDTGTFHMTGNDQLPADVGHGVNYSVSNANVSFRHSNLVFTPGPNGEIGYIGGAQMSNVVGDVSSAPNITGNVINLQSDGKLGFNGLSSAEIFRSDSTTLTMRNLSGNLVLHTDLFSNSNVMLGTPATPANVRVATNSIGGVPQGPSGNLHVDNSVIAGYYHGDGSNITGVSTLTNAQAQAFIQTNGLAMTANITSGNLISTTNTVRAANIEVVTPVNTNCNVDVNGYARLQANSDTSKRYAIFTNPNGAGRGTHIISPTSASTPDSGNIKLLARNISFHGEITDSPQASMDGFVNANVSLGGPLTSNSNITTTGTISAGASATDTHTFTGNVDVTGNIEVSGNLNYRNVQDLYVRDQSITLNANAASDATVSIIANRPVAGTNTVLRWNETDDKWQFTNDGSTYNDILTTSQSKALLSTTTASASSGGSLAYDNSSGVFTFAPADLSDKIELTNLSVTEVSPSGNGSLAYNNGTGVFTFTPADISAGGGGGGLSNAQAQAFIQSNGLTMTAPISSNSNISTTAFFEGDLNGAVTIDVYNNEASTLNKGEAVYLTGGNNGDNPWVALADSDDATKMPAIGIIRENISAGAVGQVVTSGVLNNSSHGYTIGADLFIDSVAGGLTTTLPTGESKAIQKIGKVVSPNHIIVQGAFRTNQTPNLDNNRIFIGNAANRATTVGLDSLSTELYTSDTFGAKTLTQGQNGMFNSNTSGGDYLDMNLFTNPVFPNGTRIQMTGGVAGNPFTNGTITSDNVFYTQAAGGGNYRLFTDSGLTSPTSSGQNDYTSADAPDVNYSALSVSPSGVTHTKDVVAADTLTIGESVKDDAVLTLHGEQSIYNANASQTALYIEAKHSSADASPKIMLRRNRSDGASAGDKLGGIIFDGQSAASSVVYPLTGGALIAGSGNTGSFDEISYAGGGTDPNWSDSTAITGQNGTGDPAYFNGNTYYTKSIGGGGYQLYTNSALSTGSTSGLSGIYTGESTSIEFASQGAPQRVTYANILTKVTSPTHSSEDGEIDFNVIKAGTETNILNVNSTGLKLDGNLQINADTDVSGLSGLTFDKSTNNLGLGTPTPKAAIHIRGTSNESQIYMTEFNSGSGAGIDFRTFAAAGSESVPATKGNNKRIWERFHNAYDGTGSSGDGISTGFETAFAEQILTEASHSSQSVPVYYQLYNFRDGDTTQNPTPLLRARGNGEIEFGSPVGSAFTQNAVANTIIKPTGEITTTGNVTASYFKGDGSQLTGIGGGSTNSFGTLTVSGQTNIQASQANAQVQFAAGSGVTITTAGNVMTFASTAGASYGNAEVQNYLASGNNAGNIATKGNVIVAKHTGTVTRTISSYFGSNNTGSNDQIQPSTDPQWTNSTLITFSGTTNGDLTFLNGNSYYTKSIGGGFYEIYTDSGLSSPVQSGLDGEAPSGLIASYPGEVESTLNVAGDIFTTGNFEVSSANVLTTITEYQGNNTTGQGDVILIGSDQGWYNGQYVTFQGATDSSLTFLNGNTYQVGTGGGSGTTWNLYTNYQSFTKLSTAIGTISNPSGPTLVDHRTPNDTSATIYGDLIVNANSVLKVNAIESFFPNQVINLTGLRVNDFKGNDPLNPPSYTNTQLATLQAPFPGGYAFVTGDRAVNGEGVPIYWSGTQWKYFSDNANVSYT